MQQRRDIGGTRIHIHRDHRNQHQDGPKQRIKEELEGGINPVFAAPDTDNQEHRDKACLEHHVKQDQVKRAEHRDHQGFQHQKRDHVFFNPVGDIPTGGDHQRHQKRG